MSTSIIVVCFVLFMLVSRVISSCDFAYKYFGLSYACKQNVSNHAVNLNLKFKLCQEDPTEVIVKINVYEKAVNRKIFCTTSSNFKQDIGGLFVLHFRFQVQPDETVKFIISRSVNMSTSLNSKLGAIVFEEQTPKLTCFVIWYWFLSQPTGIKAAIVIALFLVVIPICIYCYIASRQRLQGSFSIVPLSRSVLGRKPSSRYRKTDDIPMI